MDSLVARLLIAAFDYTNTYWYKLRQYHGVFIYPRLIFSLITYKKVLKIVRDEIRD